MKILGLSGRKQSGKTTASNLILGQYLLSLGIVRGITTVNNEGRLFISDLWGDEDFTGELDIYRKNDMMDDFREKHVHPYVKLYSFADALKQKVCIETLGLTYEQCFGTDEQKNSETHLMWENMPGVIAEPNILNELLHKYTKDMCVEYDKEQIAVDTLEKLGVQYHCPGPMTAREVMQYVGTDIFRRMYGNVWVDATIRQIQKDDSEFAIITDCRFPNEVEGIQKAGGKVIRLTRNPFNDKHESETILDKENYDWSNFDAVIDNANATIAEQDIETSKVLRQWKMLPKVIK